STRRTSASVAGSLSWDWASPRMRASGWVLAMSARTFGSEVVISTFDLPSFDSTSRQPLPSRRTLAEQPRTTSTATQDQNRATMSHLLKEAESTSFSGEARDLREADNRGFGRAMRAGVSGNRPPARISLPAARPGYAE